MEIMYALLDRRTNKVIWSISSPNGYQDALAAAEAHELSGYLSVVKIDGWGNVLTPNLRNKDLSA